MTTRILRVALAIATLLLVLGGSATPAWASCIAPQIEVTPPTVKPGGTVTITGRGFMAECRDTIMPTTSTTLPPVQPIRGIDVVFEQSGRRASLATVDANADFTLAATVDIPQIATNGVATLILVVGPNEVARADIVIASSGSGELARTGSTFRLAAAGGVLIALGLGFSSTAHRRCERRQPA